MKHKVEAFTTNIVIHDSLEEAEKVKSVFQSKNITLTCFIRATFFSKGQFCFLVNDEWYVPVSSYAND